VPPGRFQVRVWEGTRRGSRSQQYLRSPIRGRDADEARTRALDVLHNYVGLDQFRLLVEEAARDLVPAARMAFRETAREVMVSVDAPEARPRAPLTIRREQIVDRRASREALRALVRTYLRQLQHLDR
jgi:hypothetical protein